MTRFPPAAPSVRHPAVDDGFHREAEDGWQAPHAHLILEAWPVDRKSRLGNHIDVYHTDASSNTDVRVQRV